MILQRHHCRIGLPLVIPLAGAKFCAPLHEQKHFSFFMRIASFPKMLRLIAQEAGRVALPEPELRALNRNAHAKTLFVSLVIFIIPFPIHLISECSRLKSSISLFIKRPTRCLAI